MNTYIRLKKRSNNNDTTMRKILTALYTLTGLLLALPASAQRIITGKVVDADNEPLAGAAVFVKEQKTIGMTTDTQGNYRLRLPDNKGYTLQASYIGYITQSCRLAPQQTKKDFIMEEDAIGMETVVVTGTRTPKLLKDVPITTRVITADDIRKTDATHIGDLLQAELPGIEFSYSMDQQVSLNMQGFGGNAILFLVDGERLAGETLDNIDYTRLNLDNVERVEIVKGAASSLYGSNAVGGVVNIISKEPSEPWTLNLNGRYGSHNDQRYGGTVSFKAGDFRNSINVQHTSTDPIDVGATGKDGEENSFSKVYGNRTWNFKERLVYTSNNLKLTGRLGYFFRERDKSASSKDRYRDFSGGLKGNYSFGSGNGLELSYSFDQYDKSDYDAAQNLDMRDYTNVQHTVRALYNHSFNKSNTLTVGGDFMRDYLMSYQFTDNGNYEQYTADAFAQYDWSPLKGFNILASLRYDYFSEAKAQNFSPKVNFMYQIGNCSLRASYAGGFRAPTLKEMYMDFNMANIFMIYGNPDLKPERSQNFSLSAEYMKSRYNLTLTGYFNIVDNRINTAWNQALNGMVYTNMKKMNISGIDATAAAKYPCGFGMRLSYAFTHERVRYGQPYTSNTRPHALTARFEYGKDWKNYGFSVALNGRLLSKVTTDEYISENSFESTEAVTYPAYTIWKLNVSQQVYKGVNVIVNVDNLLNYRPDHYYNNTPTTTGTTFSVGLSLDVDKLF